VNALAAVSTVTTDAVAAPLREFLVWVARCPRTYSDAMEAWRSSCPRFTVWEDALAANLIQVLPTSGAAADARVILTPRGQFALASPKP
jgi:hypothetical protein